MQSWACFLKLSNSSTWTSCVCRRLRCCAVAGGLHPDVRGGLIVLLAAVGFILLYRAAQISRTFCFHALPFDNVKSLCVARSEQVAAACMPMFDRECANSSRWRRAWTSACGGVFRLSQESDSEDISRTAFSYTNLSVADVAVGFHSPALFCFARRRLCKSQEST